MGEVVPTYHVDPKRQLAIQFIMNVAPEILDVQTPMSRRLALLDVWITTFQELGADVKGYEWEEWTDERIVKTVRSLVRYAAKILGSMSRL